MTSTVGSERDTILDRACGLASTAGRAADAPGVDRFIRRYYADTSTDDLAARRPDDLAGAALAHWRLAARRLPGTTLVSVSNPAGHPDGWQSPHTVVMIVVDDMPFVVDSVLMEIERHGIDRQLLVHPIVPVRRNDDGNLLGVVDTSGTDVTTESFLRVEVDRETDPSLLAALHDDLTRVLDDVRLATSDRANMVDAMQRIIDDLARNPPPVASDELNESRSLLEWLVDNHFTLLGYREYELRTVDGTDALVSVPNTGLGILRERGDTDAGGSRSFSRLSPEQRRLAHDHSLLVLTKANSRSTVHRPTHLDYVGVKRFGDTGSVIGERRFLGLYTSTAYSSSPTDIPLLRHKVASTLARAGFPPNSHSGRDLVAILESYPRDELFQIDVDELYETAMGILQLQHRRRVRLFVRRDPFHRFVSCLVYLPRDRYTTAVRLRIAALLERAFGASDHEYQARVSESVLAHLYFVLRTPPGAPLDVDVHELEQRLAEAIRSWSDNLRDALVSAHGEIDAIALTRRYANAFPPAYQDVTTPAAAVDDIEFIERVPAPPDVGLRLALGEQGTLVLTVFGSGVPLPLSRVMPLLQTMGVSVIDEHPYVVRPADGSAAWIEQFGLTASDVDVTALGVSKRRDTFCDALAAVVRGDAENDAFNTLVLSAQLSWREVVMLRAYGRYLRQTGTRFSQEYLAHTLAVHPTVTRKMVDLFLARFDPDRRSGGGQDEATLSASITADLDAVTSLDEDRILRAYLHLVLATTRTTYFQSPEAPPAYVAVKLDPEQVPDLPLPRPMFEIFVYSPRVEGVHLRMGRVARGGIRWSDRREDFRTEILGLMKAQMVKNAVIVPVGAKGGFVVKQPPPVPEELQTEVVECYRAYVGALLDLTDNLVGGRVVPPDRVVRYDDDDTYLVVAADKGTSAFSDLANEVALSRGFWLGDAFASGGSTGYDHKKMGITAKGAWESVRRHFRQLGVDIETTNFTVVGIGDMSGDVFGNGLLLSDHILLLAAFDHRHVFLDPDPDPVESFVERQRLLGLPRSSWDDYDRTKLSPGGGVFSRRAKSIPITPEVRARLGITATALTPTALIAAILRAPVDLMWNGGIGTYVKASTERNADVGDKANDAIRVNGADLRCKAVGEGGNLGFTQRGRIEFALRGGLIHTDAIDNSAGVDCSDHEVNIKILLDEVAAAGQISLEERNELLAAMASEVELAVLLDNYRQVRALALALILAFPMEDVHARFLRNLAQAGKLDRALEFLPDDEMLADRRGDGIGLTVPELAVLLAYAKITIDEELLASDVPDDHDVRGELMRYFPGALQERFGDVIVRHPLRREIVANALVNDMVNRSGTSFAFWMAEETGASTAEIVRAEYVARRIFGQDELWREIAALDNLIPADVQTSMYLESAKLVERATRWLLRAHHRSMSIAATLAFFESGVARCAEALPSLLRSDEARWLESCSDSLIADDVPAALARKIAMQESLFTALDIVDLATASRREVEEVTAVHNAVADRLELGWLRDRVVDDLPRHDRWQALARSALRDDAYSEHRLITAAVLAGSEPGTDADAALDRWIEHDPAGVARALALVDDIRSHATYDLANLSVALREMRNLIE